MSKRKIKKDLSKGLQSVIDNAHDVAVMHNVLWYILGTIKGKNVIINSEPFRDNDLNNIFSFVDNEIKDKSCTKK